jgi:DUF4097 and DUF4098 domain-containing protein YvlB
VSARKIGLLFLILGFGAAMETAWNVRRHVDFGPEGCRVLGGRFYGPSWSFADETRRAAPAGARVEVTNAFGAVRISLGDPGEVKVGLRKVVFLPTEERARAFAGRVTLRAELQGDVVQVGTNRDDLGRDDRVGLETHLDLRVPPGTAVVVRNEHGQVTVADVAKADITASYDGVEVSRVSGGLQLKSRHGSVAISEVGGDLTLDARYGDVEVEGVKGRASLEVRHGHVTVKRTGALKLDHAYGDVDLREVAGNLEVKAEHAGIEARDVTGDAGIETSFNGVQLTRIGGKARVKTQHGEIRAAAVTGALTAEASFGSVELEDVGGPVEVTVVHGGVRAQTFTKGGRFKASGEDVTLDRFEGAVDVEAERASAHIAPRGAITEGISVRVSHGGIRLEVPTGSRFDLEAVARRGEVRADLPGFAVSRSDARHVSGKLAGGGSPVTLAADGDVELEPRTANARGER